MKKIEKPNAISIDEEKAIVHHIQFVGEWGYQFTAMGMRYVAKHYLDNADRVVKKFRKNLPSQEFSEETFSCNRSAQA